MVSLNKEQIGLIEILKAALFDLSPKIPESINWDNLLKFAKDQCIVPLVIAYVPAENRNEWFQISYQIRAHYMQMIYEQDSLVKLFKANNIPLAIFKGTAAAIYYPNPSLRTFGDVDFYIPENQWESAVNLLEKNGYLFFSKDSREYEFNKNGIEFELHSMISSKHYNNIDHIYNNGLKNVVEYKIGNFAFPGFPTYENGLILLGHIMQHLKETGIGLRQILDWMMYVHNELDDLAWVKYFKAFAVEAGLEKLAITVTYMCKKWFGLPDNITWCNGADETIADQLLIRVFEDGNFGHNRALFENIKRYIRNEGLFKYLQRAGIDNWSLAQKYKIFRPFAWVYQICVLFIKGVIGLVNGKKVFRKANRNMSLEELLEKL